MAAAPTALSGLADWRRLDVGALAAIAGATSAGVGGYLGGHLVLTMKVPEPLA